MSDSLHVFDGKASDERDKLKLVTPFLGLYFRMLADERVGQSSQIPKLNDAGNHSKRSIESDRTNRQS